MDIFSSTTVPLLERKLNGSSLQQKVLAQNIANVDTPYYKAKEVVFGDELSHAMSARKTESRHIPFSHDVGPRVVENHSTKVQNNGNNVDIDKEMSELAKNQIEYQAEVESLNHKFQQYKMVLGGGR